MKGKVSILDSGRLRADDVDEACSRIDVRVNTTTQCSDYSNSSTDISASFLFPPGMLRSSVMYDMPHHGSLGGATSECQFGTQRGFSHFSRHFGQHNQVVVGHAFA